MMQQLMRVMMQVGLLCQEASGWQGLEGGDVKVLMAMVLAQVLEIRMVKVELTHQIQTVIKSFDLRFLVDTSTSMNCSNERGEVESTYCEGGAGSRIELAKKLIKDIRDSFSEDTKTSLINYDLNAKTILSLNTSEESALYSALIRFRFMMVCKHLVIFIQALI